MGSLFGEVLSRAIGDVRTVVEVGAGEGTLAASIQRASTAEYVALEFADTLPDHVDGVIIANELLDNLPFRLFERGSDGWLEVYVEDGTEVFVPAEVPIEVNAPLGGRVPLQERTAQWVRDATEAAPRVIAFDYTSTTVAMAHRPWTEWVRTYRAQGRGAHPLKRVGEQDITCQVAIDQLPPPTRVMTQAEFLREHGLDELVDAARSAWQERAHIGDLQALKHRARLTEADALADPAGLGGFTVLEWRRG